MHKILKTNQRFKCVCYKREFVITQFVISKFDSILDCAEILIFLRYSVFANSFSPHNPFTLEMISVLFRGSKWLDYDSWRTFLEELAWRKHLNLNFLLDKIVGAGKPSSKN